MMIQRKKNKMKKKIDEDNSEEALFHYMWTHIIMKKTRTWRLSSIQ